MKRWRKMMEIWRKKTKRRSRSSVSGQVKLTNTCQSGRSTNSCVEVKA